MIQVNNDYFIEIDNLNYTAKRDTHRSTIKVDKITGKELEIPQYSVVGYYGSLIGALKGIIDNMNKRALMDGEHNLEEALKIVMDNNNKLIDLLEKVLGSK